MAAEAMAVFSCTWPGIPLIYSGQEKPNTKRLAFFEKDFIDWEGEVKLHEFYKTVLSFRKKNKALQKVLLYYCWRPITRMYLFICAAASRTGYWCYLIFQKIRLRFILIILQWLVIIQSCSVMKQSVSAGRKILLSNRGNIKCIILRVSPRTGIKSTPAGTIKLLPPL